MTTEEKAKAYDIALDKIKRLLGTGSNCSREDLEYVFPELKESEDEKIRKHLIGVVELYYGNTDEQEKKDCLAWLEKQSKDSPILSNSSNTGKIEQKPAWSEDDEENLNWFEKFFRAESVIAEGKDIPQDRYLWFKNLKGRVQPQPKQEWSEEDESCLSFMIKNIELCKEGKSIYLTPTTAIKYIDWLKSLRPQNTWKPSDEQIESLSHMIDAVENEWDCDEPVGRELLKQLKELRGE
jgi:hypothetical protein